MMAKMADDVHEGIENALNTIVNTTERSGNMKKELKHTIYENVSTLRKLFATLKDTNDSSNRAISELETLVANTRTEPDEARGRTDKGKEIAGQQPRDWHYLVGRK